MRDRERGPVIVGRRARALFLTLGAVAASACARDGASGWVEYLSDRFGYTIAYPDDWTLVEAQPREPEMVRASEFLAAGELEKLTFLEPAGGAWPGRFELRVLPNPGRLGLEEWLENLRLANLSFVNMTDTTLAGQPAKGWTRFAYDLIHDEVVTVVGDRAYLLSFDANREDDPDFANHQRIYRRMVDSFALNGR